MNEVILLITQRGRAKASLTRFWTYVQSETRDVTQVNIRRLKIEDIWHEFQKVQSAIEEMVEGTSNKSEHSVYREEFENFYFMVVSEAEKFINMSTKEEVCINAERYEQKHREEIQPQAVIKLAALEIPSFSGRYEDWTAFHDIFMALIHTNANLTDIQKFFYLRSSLSGEAKECIKCLQTTAINYKAAWSNLISRYNNKKILIQTYVKSIVDLPPLRDRSAAKVRTLTDTINTNIKALQALGEDPYSWGPLLLHIICAKLDDETRKEWEINAPKDQVPPIMDVMQFLETQFRILESLESSRNISKPVTALFSKLCKQTRGYHKENNSLRQTTSFLSTAIMKCFICNQGHTIYKCPKFLALSITERIDKIMSLKLCKICLRKHEGKCLSRFCFKCHKPHNTLLHFGAKGVAESENDDKHSESYGNSEETTVIETRSTTAYADTGQQRVLLATAIVRVVGPSGKSLLARALLDSASMNNFVSTELVHNLGLKRKKTRHVVNGIGETMQNVTSVAWLKIKSCVCDFDLNTQSLVVKKITGNLPTKFISEICPRPKNITLTDPAFNVPQRVDILIGASHFFDIIGSQQYRIVNGPIFQDTKFGYIVSGPVQETGPGKKSNTHVNNEQRENEHESLYNLIQDFWRSEEGVTSIPYTIEEKACSEHFHYTVHRDERGRFTIQLPFRENLVQLGKSYEITKRRLLAIERRLEKDPTLKTEYVKFMREYVDLNHMTYIGCEEIDEPGKMCYLAHHCVLNQNSSTTKLRVVFDASAKTENGKSLNDVLLKGPVIQDELVYILTRFRTHNYVISADIRKMYRQINIVKEHRDFQRILWRESKNDPIKTYTLNTVTYGTVPASYIATACLKKLAEVEYKNDADVSNAVSNDFYMDDFLSGAATKAATIALCDGLIKVMASAGMELGKWASNEPNILSGISHVKDELKNVHGINDTVTKILGLYWNARTDSFQFKVHVDDSNELFISKRDILSDIARIFDPLGLIGPIVIRAKLMLQRLWQAQVGWHEPVPTEIECEWHTYKTNLSKLTELIMPRQITIKEEICDMQIHGFADASEKAYGCSLYLRCSNKAGNHFSNLICAKSKVAPIKTISLPRLELCAAQLLSRIAHKIIPKMKLNISRRYYWTDSTITLCWIHSTSKKWKTFVAHRVGQIQERTLLTEWFHVQGNENPADVISRGCCPSELSQCSLWWHGPNWLLEDEKYWPVTNQKEMSETLLEIPEQKIVSVSLLTTSGEDCIIHKYSSIKKLSRIIAYCLRFRKNCLELNKD